MKISLPEQVWIDYEPATFASRFLAYVNDFCIRWGTLALLFFAGVLLTAYFKVDTPWTAVETAIEAQQNKDLLIALGVLFFFFVEWSYPIFFEVYRGGVTPGKAILGLQVVDERGLPLTFQSSFLRTTFLLIDSFPAFGILGFLCMSFSKNSQRIGDLAAKTMVVHQTSHIAKQTDQNEDESSERILLPLDVYSVLEKFLARKETIAQEARSKMSNRLLERLSSELPSDYPLPPDDETARNLWFQTLLRKSAPRKNTPQRRSQDPFMNWTQVGEQLAKAEAMLEALQTKKRAEVGSQQVLLAASEEFQSLCQLYSYLSTFYPTTAQAARAAQLVRKGRVLFYGTRLKALEERQNSFLQRVSEGFLVLQFHTTIATAIAFLSGFLASAFVFINPSLVYSLLPQETLDELQRGHLWTEEVRGWSASGAAEIMVNNIKVSFFCFASGITAGVATILLLIQNGANVGALLAATSYYRMNSSLFEFMLAHGFLEISVIMVSSGCGLYIGDGLISPGPLTRLKSLQNRVAKVTPLVLFNALSLVLAGYIEGHVSPYAEYSFGSKLLIGVTIACGYWYLLLRSAKGSFKPFKSVRNVLARGISVGG